MRIITVFASIGPFNVGSSGLCAERRLIKRLQLYASRHGISRNMLSLWFYRKYGRIEVQRHLADGTPACSLPCVCCAKRLGRFSLRWTARAWDGSQVLDSSPDKPIAQATRAQKGNLGFK